jgi:hypothetical protein
VIAPAIGHARRGNDWTFTLVVLIAFVAVGTTAQS